MALSLTSANFDSSFRLTVPNENVVVLFYRPGCPHCDVYHPEYTKAAQQGVSGVLFAEVNTGDHPEVLQQLGQMNNPPFKIRGVPTVVSFHKGQYFSTYGANNDQFRTVQDTLEYASGVGKSDTPIVYKK